MLGNYRDSRPRDVVFKVAMKHLSKGQNLNRFKQLLNCIQIGRLVVTLTSGSSLCSTDPGGQVVAKGEGSKCWLIPSGSIIPHLAPLSYCRLQPGPGLNWGKGEALTLKEG